jgi:hypothetical protein
MPGSVELDGEAAIKAQAAAQLNALEHHAITLTPVPGHSTYLEAGGFLPGHQVTLTIDGKAITTLRASTLGNVTYMISPSLLHLPSGAHALSSAVRCADRGGCCRAAAARPLRPRRGRQTD